jgi:hypothetical protein
MYPNHVLLSWGGSLHGVEQHVTGLRLIKNAGAAMDEGDLVTFMADLEPDLRAYVQNSGLSNGYFINWIKCNFIGPDGKYVNKTSTNRRDITVPIQGTATTCHAPQVACAVTLVTAAQRGLASKGRFFQAGLGLAQFGIDPASGGIGQLEAQNFRDRVKTLINAINNNPGLDSNFGGLDVSVVSGGGITGAGIARKVTAVKVGRILDTQRRRRASLPENYVAPAAVS